MKYYFIFQLYHVGTNLFFFLQLYANTFHWSAKLAKLNKELLIHGNIAIKNVKKWLKFGTSAERFLTTFFLSMWIEFNAFVSIAMSCVHVVSYRNINRYEISRTYFEIPIIAHYLIIYKLLVPKISFVVVPLKRKKKKWEYEINHKMHQFERITSTSAIWSINYPDEKRHNQVCQSIRVNLTKESFIFCIWYTIC